jgi:ubiquinone biosynthesis protein Coq4
MMKAGGGWARFWVGLRAGTRLLGNPRDTRQVFLLGLAVDHERIRLIHQRMMASASGRALLTARPSIDSSAVDYAALRALPEDTLGGAYARMLQREGLDPDLFQAPPAVPEGIAFVVKRIRQTHDLWHVLTGLSTDIPGEVALQAFAHAQLQNNTSRLLSGVGLLYHRRRFPELPALVKQYRALGERAVFLLAVPWEEHWESKLEDVRRNFLGGEVPAPTIASYGCNLFRLLCASARTHPCYKTALALERRESGGSQVREPS